MIIRFHPWNLGKPTLRFAFCSFIYNLLAKGNQCGQGYYSHDRYKHKDIVSKAKLNGHLEPELLRSLVRPLLPHPLLYATLFQLVQPVVEEAQIFRVVLQ